MVKSSAFRSRLATLSSSFYISIHHHRHEVEILQEAWVVLIDLIAQQRSGCTASDVALVAEVYRSRSGLRPES